MDLSFPDQQTATATSCIPHDSVYMRGPCAGKSENGSFRCDTWLQIFQNDSKICEAEVTLTPLINKICKPCHLSTWISQNHSKLYFHLFSGLSLLEIVLGGEELRTGNWRNNCLMNSILLIQLYIKCIFIEDVPVVEFLIWYVQV